MRVSVALFITALFAPVLAAPALNLDTSNAVVKRNVAPMDAVDLSKREISFGRVSRDIDAASGNIYARDGSTQLPQLTNEAVAQGLLSQPQASSLLGNFGGASSSETSMMTTAMSKLLQGYSTGAISGGQASSLLAPFTNAGAGGSAGGLLSLITGLLGGMGGLGGMSGGSGGIGGLGSIPGGLGGMSGGSGGMPGGL